ncbi:MAG: NAD(P)/FAD-dependent oxidoreductase [Candidatus Cloacimonetes bacterium]|nr:NAD(P)/FAD-dependent oxidoreductase [Candidatus Cloacimonadota bacterium]
MFKDKYDVVVVGSGIAGSAAAYSAAKHGASVLLIERESKAGYPTRCAEGVYLKNIDAEFEIPESCIARRVSSMVLHAPDGNSCCFGNIGAGLILNRNKFIEHIINNAISFGAEFSPATIAEKLTLSKSDEYQIQLKTKATIANVRSNIIIAADGIESRIGRLAGFDTTLEPKDLEIGYQYRVKDDSIDADRIHIYLGRDIAPGGYAWSFPKGLVEANIGLAINPEEGKSVSARAYCDSFLKRFFPNANVLSATAGGIPICTPKTIYGDGIMFAGDAARMVNPLTGGGNETALRFGKIAGKIAAETISKGDWSKNKLKKYQSLWNKEYGFLHKTLYQIGTKTKTMSDARINEFISIFNSIPVENRNLKTLFIKALSSNPGLLIRLSKSYLFG